MKSVFIYIIILISITAGGVYADIIYVDDANNAGPWDGSFANPYRYIQEGIDAAVNGDTVMVLDGTYTGEQNRDMDFAGKAITVKSQNGPDDCIIDCQDSGRAFQFSSGEDENSVLEGFTITNGRVTGDWPAGCGGAVECINESSPTINNNIIIDNWAENAGGGIRCDDRSSPTITNNTIQENVAVVGGGIRCNSISDPVIDGNVITLNNVTGYGGGISCAHLSDPEITNNTIMYNSADLGGGGIRCIEYSSPLIANNVIVYNSGDEGSAVNITLHSSPKLINNTISNNTSSGSGGIHCYGDCHPTIENTILWDNPPQEIFLSPDPPTSIHFLPFYDIDDSEPPCSATISYSDVEGGQSGVVIEDGGTLNWNTGNIDADPEFTGYSLKDISPCIGAGSTVADMPDQDIEGTLRPTPIGSSPDMGAYENTLGEPSATVMVLSPNGEEIWKGGSDREITWQSQGSGIQSIQILYSTDGGSSYNKTVVNSTDDDGSYMWQPVASEDSDGVKVKVIAKDASMETITEDTSNGNFTIDSTAPETTAVLDGTSGENGWYISNVKVSLSATDNLSGVWKIYYQINDQGWLEYDNPFIVTGSTIKYRAEDNAGNTESFKTETLNIDKTGPTKPNIAEHDDFTNSTTELSISWTESNDGESGLAEYQYAIGTTSGGTDVRGWTSVGTDTSVIADGLDLTGGVTYYSAVRAKNSAGLFSDVDVDDGITVDITPPVTSVQLVGTEGENGWYISNVTVTLSAFDEYSGVNNIQYKINEGSWTTYTEPFVVSGSVIYYKSMDNIGNTEEEKSLTVKVDTKRPSMPVITDEGDYTASDTLSVSWTESLDEESEIADYKISVGKSAGSTDVMDWTSAGLVLEKDITGLDLADGEIYYVNVRAKNEAGIFSFTSSTDGISVDTVPPETTIQLSGQQGQNGWWTSDVEVTLTAWDEVSGVKETQYKINDGEWLVYTESFNITGSTVYYKSEDNVGNLEDEKSQVINIDKTPPTAPEVSDEGDYINSSNLVIISWTDSEDTGSGITGYMYAIGTTPGGSDVLGWTWVGMVNSMESAIELDESQTYYASVRGKNNAGLLSDIASSDGITVDSNPPVTTVKIEGTEGENGWYLSDVTATLNAEDEVSGIKKTQYRINDGDWIDYSEPFVVSGSTIYYYSEDNAGYIEDEKSLDINIDKTPPSAPVVNDGGGYINSSAQITISWTHSEDVESGIMGYMYAVGLISGENDVLDWTWLGMGDLVNVEGIELDEGQTYYVSVKGKNNAGLLSDASISDGITVDSNPPVTTIELEGTEGENGWYLSDVTVTLTAEDEISGVKKTQYRINDGEWLDYTVPFVISGSTVYYRSEDNAGYVEEDKLQEIDIDKTGPTKPVVYDSGVYTDSADELYVWITPSQDLESGFSHYEYAVGTQPGIDDVRNWFNAGDATEVLIDGLILTDGQTYYISVRAKNLAGLFSETGFSDGITVDLSLIRKDLNLYQGWNYISFSLDPVNSEISNLLISITESYRAVWTYDNTSGSWLSYIPDRNNNTLENLESGRGYWFDMRQEAVLSFIGRIVENNVIRLLPGWNSVDSAFNVNIGDILSADVSAFYTFNNLGKTWSKTIFDSPIPINEIQSLEPDKGYMIYSDIDLLWTIEP
ncbi:hypothetical protein GF312_01665 [Candidatus Poribacteria bacterium]|nr:hypothetical protein [Candidatus Poribacteria bacterium]